MMMVCFISLPPLTTVAQNAVEVNTTKVRPRGKVGIIINNYFATSEASSKEIESTLEIPFDDMVTP